MTLRTWSGIVCSKPANQETTCMVQVSTLKKHPKYGKYIKVMRKYIVHDTLSCPVGAEVIIQEVPKRISKTKSKTIIRRVD
jgi:ribosomal protein S17